MAQEHVGARSALTAGLEGASASWPRAFQSQRETCNGYNILHGRPHSFKWKLLYRVTVEFETAAEAQEFFESLHEGGIVTSND